MASNLPANDTELSARERLAFTVVSYAGAGLALLILIIVGFAGYTAYMAPQDLDNSSALVLTVFNATLPLVGTWVGTVLAFYFTRENFTAASQQAIKLVGSLSEEKLKSTSVEQAMLPFDSIKGARQLLSSDGEKDIKTKDLLESLKPPVNRVPIFGKHNDIKYILHDSMIYKDAAVNDLTIKEQTGERDRTLDDMLKEKENRELFGAFSVLPTTATLADAKSKMDNGNCRDVFVTKRGSPTETVLGWVTDRDIAINARV